MTEVSANEPVVIRSEADAWEVLKKALLTGDLLDTGQLRFEGWPLWSMDAKGRDWHSTVPTRIMPPLLEVQNDVNRAFAQAQYGEFNLRRLRDEDRELLELVVRVAPGSSLFSADLSSQLNRIAGAVFGRMSGTQATIAVLGIALAISAPVTYKAWLHERQTEKQLQTRVDLSQQETERLKVFASAVKREPAVGVVRDDANETTNKLLKATRPGDSMAIHGVAVGAEEARQLVKPERERAREIELHGQFRVIGNRTDKGSGFRITLRAADGTEFRADVPEELDFDAKQAIQQAEWGKYTVTLVIEAQRLHDKIQSATVISAQAADP